MKWYIAWPVVSLLTGGSTPKASQVRKMTLFGCLATQGIFAFGMYSIGYEQRVFSVMVSVVKVHHPGPLARRPRSPAPRRSLMARKMSGSASAERLIALRVAAALDVEDAGVAPAVLVVADQGPLRVGGERGLPGAGQPEEAWRRRRIFTLGGRAVHREDALLRHEVVHDGEDALLHLPRVFGA
jgi:hypothetical protein